MAFRAYESIVAQGDTRGCKRLYDEIYENFHGKEGDKTSIGLAKKCVKGLEMFEFMYDIDVGSGQHVMKEVLHPDQPHVKIIAHKDKELQGINLTTLSGKSKNDPSSITDRSMWEWAKEVEANGRKMAAIIERSPYKNMTVASGEAWEDYLKYCRYKFMMLMKKEYQAKKKAAKKGKEKAQEKNAGAEDLSEEEEDADVEVEQEEEEEEDPLHAREPGEADGEEEAKKEEEEDEEDHDPPSQDVEAQKIKDWNGKFVFNGFIAWALWGHLTPKGGEEYKATAFWSKNNTPKEDKHTMTRKSARMDAASASRRDRTNSLTSEGRGVPHKDYVAQQMMKDSSDFNKMLNSSLEYQSNVTALQTELNVLEKHLNVIQQDLQTLAPIVMCPDRAHFWEDVTGWAKKFPPFGDYLKARESKEEVLERMNHIADEIHSLNATRARSSKSIPSVVGATAEESAGAAASASELPPVGNLLGDADANKNTDEDLTTSSD